MKEVEKNEIKRLSDRLDAIHHQQADLSLVDAAEKYAELEKEKATIETELVRLREVQRRTRRRAEAGSPGKAGGANPPPRTTKGDVGVIAS